MIFEAVFRNMIQVSYNQGNSKKNIYFLFKKHFIGYDVVGSRVNLNAVSQPVKPKILEGS